MRYFDPLLIAGVVLVWLVPACFGGRDAGAPVEPVPASPAVRSSAAPSVSAVSPRLAPLSPASPGSSAESRPTAELEDRYQGYAFERRLDVPVRSLALGQPPMAAVLSDEPIVYDGKTWTVYPLPENLRARSQQSEQLEIFFGRDNRPRLMGTRTDQNAVKTSVYLRLVDKGWRREPAELGPLAAAQGGLYGLLGFDDPEIVCAPQERCLLKRTSGWQSIGAENESRRFHWTPFGVYKQEAGELMRLDGNGWQPVIELKANLFAACHDTRERLWLATSGGVVTLEMSTSSIRPVATAVGPVRAIYCAAPDQVWLAGAELSYYDGKRVFMVDGVVEPIAIAIAMGRGRAEIWLAGEGGVYVGTPRLER